MANDQGVWVFIEQQQGRMADVSRELLGKARELADRLQTDVTGLLCGHNVRAVAKEAIRYGADRVLLADDPELELFRTLPYARVAVEAVREYKPDIFLIGASPFGRDLAPRVASTLRCGLTADCTDLQIGDFTDKKTKQTHTNLLYQIRPAFGGNVIATIVNPTTRPQMATVREGVMRMADPQDARKGKIVKLAPVFKKKDLALNVLSRTMRESTVRLKDAAIIVSGGAGVGGADGFQLLRDLANLLGGEVGASRAAVDAGFIAHEHQVGQTGTTVRPRLYIAAGISGAIQHRAGMDQSNKIIAVNTDPDAPIFQIAHYKIVGDLEEVVPLIVHALRDKTK